MRNAAIDSMNDAERQAFFAKRPDRRQIRRRGRPPPEIHHVSTFPVEAVETETRGVFHPLPAEMR